MTNIINFYHSSLLYYIKSIYSPKDQEILNLKKEINKIKEDLNRDENKNEKYINKDNNKADLNENINPIKYKQISNSIIKLDELELVENIIKKFFKKI